MNTILNTEPLNMLKTAVLYRVRLPPLGPV
uniref:Uncharacterized protein n=1 Tax=Siphoviridae sp. ctEqU3 TaxID=2825399 RepID=A0A8S5P163_9CAUD|nr:MAG TPA: hypothetical protein [Siphoviridae sp. ctEqU3]DAX85584.1 MAG TPA: hypothetical protein [Caudoviricetes sp.]